MAPDGPGGGGLVGKYHQWQTKKYILLTVLTVIAIFSTVPDEGRERVSMHYPALSQEG